MQPNPPDTRIWRRLAATATLVAILVAQIWGFFMLAREFSTQLSGVIDNRLVASLLGIAGGVLILGAAMFLAILVWLKLCDRFLSAREMEKLTAELETLNED